MLVALGAALFLALVLRFPEYNSANIGRVLQGVVLGLGFLGAGAIIKLRGEQEIQGLTTAAGIWFTAAIGATVGLGQIAAAVVGAILAWIILAALRPIESWVHGKSEPPATADDSHHHERG